MLTFPEKILFALATLASLTATGYTVRRLVRIITAGQGRPDWRLAGKRLGNVLVRVVTFQPVFRARFWSSLFHALVGWTWTTNRGDSNPRDPRPARISTPPSGPSSIPRYSGAPIHLNRPSGSPGVSSHA